MTRAAWGIHLNGKTYSEEALITQNGWQYSTYYDKERYFNAILPENCIYHGAGVKKMEDWVTTISITPGAMIVG